MRPGSYDFGRDMYFQGIGASGFVMGAIKSAEPPASGGLSLRYAAFMQGLRDAIDARIRTALDGDRRAIATALLTGRRDTARFTAGNVEKLSLPAGKTDHSEWDPELPGFGVRLRAGSAFYVVQY